MDIFDHILRWGERNKAVWSTAMQNDLPDSAFLYISPGGSKDAEGKTTPRSLRHFPFKEASGKVDVVHVRNALARIPQADIPDSAKAAATARASKLLKDAGGEPSADTEKGLALGAEGSLIVHKAADGTYTWTLLSSNAFQDRDREIVSHKALADDVARADGDGDYGPLRWWHEPGAELGDCTFNAMHGRMLIEAGTFRNPQIAERVKEHASDLGVSIGFTHPASEPDAGGVFHRIRRFERSLLPREVASNPLTAVSVSKKENTMLKEKADALRKVLGGDDALVKQVLDLADSTEKAADASGIRFKELGSAAKPGETFEVDGETFVKTADGHILTVKAKTADAPPVTTDAKRDKPYTKPEATDTEDATDGGDDEAAEGEKKGKKKTKAAELAEVLEPFAAQMETRFKALLSEQAEPTATTLKAVNDKLAALETAVKKAQGGVDELTGELPRGYKRWRASQDGPEPPAHAQQAEPVEDPWGKHFKAIQTAAGVPGAQ